MKLRIIPATALIGMLCITSCMEDRPNPSDVQKEIKVSATIEGSITSRANTRASNSTWHDADAIGIFMKYNDEAPLSLSALAINAKYATDGTGIFYATESNQIYFPFNDDKVDFIAYYPHTNSLDGLHYPIDVSNQSSLPDIDLLYSNNSKGISASKGIAELIFKHQLSKVILNISMFDNTQQDLTGLTAQIMNVNTKATFSLIDGTLSDEGDKNNVQFNMSDNGKLAQAILLPASSLDNISLVLTLDSISYSLSLSAAKNITSFDKSTKHTLNVTLKPGEGPELDSVTATIEDWVDGTKEDFIADEDSSYTPPGKPGEGDGDEEDLNEGEDDQYVGDGSKDYPYTVTQAKEITSENRVWVKGYIVGYYGHSWESSLNDGPTNVDNVAIADSSVETEYINTFKIDFLNDPDVGNTIRLKENPDNILKMAYFYGDIEQFKEKSVLKNVTEAFIVNTTPEE